MPDEKKSLARFDIRGYQYAMANENGTTGADDVRSLLESATLECINACVAFERFHAEIMALVATEAGIAEAMLRKDENYAMTDRVAAAGKAMRLALASVPQ